MKRSPLKRKSPLRRGDSTLKKSRLKPMSRAKSKWMTLYKEMCSRDGIDPKTQDRHHPFGRIGDRLLAYVIIPQRMHQQIHYFGGWGRSVGWLQPEFEGCPHDPESKRPWAKSDEKGWPEHLKRK